MALFCSERYSRAENFSWVDLLLIRNDELWVIVEIEESNVKPAQICGKFLTSALCNHYKLGAEREPVRMADSLAFVQVVNEAKVKDRGAKKQQWTNLEDSIRSILPFRGIRDYRLFPGTREGFLQSPGPEIANYLRSVLGA